MYLLFECLKILLSLFGLLISLVSHFKCLTNCRGNLLSLNRKKNAISVHRQVERKAAMQQWDVHERYTLLRETIPSSNFSVFLSNTWLGLVS